MKANIAVSNGIDEKIIEVEILERFKYKGFIFFIHYDYRQEYKDKFVISHFETGLKIAGPDRDYVGECTRRCRTTRGAIRKSKILLDKFSKARIKERISGKNIINKEIL